MDRTKIVAAALVVAALTVPSAVATWYGRGDYEPNTRWDAAEGRIFTDADTTLDTPGLAGERVYFNGFIENGIIGTNPNVGASVAGVAGNTRIAAFWSAIPTVMLGLWKDCNKDGYMGMAESAIIDYRSELLMAPNANGVVPGASVCPVMTRDAAETPVHNDGTWVKEFIAIGMVDPCEFESDPHRSANCGDISQFTKNWDVIYVNNTFVWDDDTRPGTAAGGGTCPLGLLPRGTTASTGGLLYYVDCFDGRRIANTVNTVDSDGTLGLRFEDPRNPQSSRSSALNQPLPAHPWGDPYRNSSGLLQTYDPTSSKYPYEPAFSVQDCSQPRKDVRDPTAPANGNGTLNQIGVKSPAGTPEALQTEQDYLLVSANLTDNNGVIAGYYGHQAPSNTHPTGSYRAAAEDAYDATYLGYQYQDKSAGDCDRSTNNTFHGEEASLPEWGEVEGDNDATGATKNVNSDVMTFYDGFRGVIDDETDGQLGIKYNPIDLGVNAVRSTYGGPSWNGAGTAGYFQYVNRNTLEPHPARFRTYYAYLDPVAVQTMGLVLPSGAGGVYGADACTSIGTGQGAQNGWECDPAKWWKDASGGDSMPYHSDATKKVPQGRKVGQAFTFRDVDCYDGHVGGVESEGVHVYASGVQLNPNDPRVCTQF